MRLLWRTRDGRGAERAGTGVPYTNNVSERTLRPSVIFRKVTNGFRCEWGAETYAAFRSAVSTAKANRASVLAVLQFVLAARLPVEASAEAGQGITIGLLLADHIESHQRITIDEGIDRDADSLRHIPGRDFVGNRSKRMRGHGAEKA